MKRTARLGVDAGFDKALELSEEVHAFPFAPDLHGLRIVNEIASPEQAVREVDMR
jgi:hypothetical protein